MVNFTEMQLKELKASTAYIRDVSVSDKYVTQLQILNSTQSLNNNTVKLKVIYS